MSDYNETKDNLIGILMSARQSVCPTDVDDISEALTLIEQQQARIAELEQRQKELTATVERLRIAALNAISIMPSGQAKADLRDAYDDTPHQSLAEHDAEVARVAFLEGANWWAQCELDDNLFADENSAANEYANKIKAGDL